VITVLFFARLREQLQCSSLELEYSPSFDVASVRANLLVAYPHWAKFLLDEKLLVAVNQTLVKASHPISDGDEVAFFPPVTGG